MTKIIRPRLHKPWKSARSVKTMSVTTLKGYDGNKKRTGRKRFIVVY